MVVIAEEVENANRSPLYIGRPVESLAFLNRRDALRSAAEAALARRRLRVPYFSPVIART